MGWEVVGGGMLLCFDRSVAAQNIQVKLYTWQKEVRSGNDR